MAMSEICLICGRSFEMSLLQKTQVCDKTCSLVSSSGLRVLRGNRQRGANKTRVRDLVATMRILSDLPDGEWITINTLSERVDANLQSLANAMRLVDPYWMSTETRRAGGRVGLQYRLIRRPESLSDLLGEQRIDKARSVFI